MNIGSHGMVFEEARLACLAGLSNKSPFAGGSPIP